VSAPGEEFPADSEWREELRRYEEALGGGPEVLDSRLLREPLTRIDAAPAACMPPDATVADAARAIAAGPRGCVLILEEDRLVGILTESDVVARVVAEGKDPARVGLAEAMTPKPTVLADTDTIGFALHKMAVGGHRHLPILDAAGRPLGVLRQREVVRYLAHFFPDEILNQPQRSFEQRPPRRRHGG